jgi:hypothetical protein
MTLFRCKQNSETVHASGSGRLGSYPRALTNQARAVLSRHAGDVAEVASDAEIRGPRGLSGTGRARPFSRLLDLARASRGAVKRRRTRTFNCVVRLPQFNNSICEGSPIGMPRVCRSVVVVTDE